MFQVLHLSNVAHSCTTESFFFLSNKACMFSNRGGEYFFVVQSMERDAQFWPTS